MKRRPGAAGTVGWRTGAGRFAPFLALVLILFRLLAMVHVPPEAHHGVSGLRADLHPGRHAHVHDAAGDAGSRRGGHEAAGAHGCHFCREMELLVPRPGSVPIRRQATERGPARPAIAALPVLDPPFLTRLRARAPPPSA